MRPVADAVVRAGLVDESILDELARWGIHITAVPDKMILNDPVAVVAHIREAIEGEDQVRIDETDLDILHRYLDKAYQKKGRLILKEGKRHQTLNITFCLTPMGEYAIPWVDEETPDIFANGETHMKWKDGETEHDVYFTDVRELYYGRRKAFVICETMEESDGRAR